MKTHRAVLHILIAAIALGLWAVPSARAHPLGGRLAAQHTLITVELDHLEIVFLAEMPKEAVWTTSRSTQPPDASMLDELEMGIVAEVDGQALRLERIVGQVISQPQADHDGWAFRLELTASADLQGTHTIKVSTGNLPDTSSFFAGTIHLGRGIGLSSTPLLEQNRRGQWVNLNGRYRLGEQHRVISATVTGRNDARARLFDQLAGTPEEPTSQLASRRTRGGFERLSDGSWSPELALAGTLWIGVIGLFAGAVTRKRATFAVSMGLAALTVISSFTPTWLALLSLPIAIALTLRWRVTRAQGLAGAVTGLPACILATSLPGLGWTLMAALLLALCITIGAVQRVGLRPTVGMGLGTVMLLLLVARALIAL